MLDIGNEVAVDMIRLIDATTPKEELLHDSLNDAIELIASSESGAVASALRARPVPPMSAVPVVGDVSSAQPSASQWLKGWLPDMPQVGSAEYAKWKGNRLSFADWRSVVGSRWMYQIHINTAEICRELQWYYAPEPALLYDWTLKARVGFTVSTRLSHWIMRTAACLKPNGVEHRILRTLQQLLLTQAASLMLYSLQPPVAFNRGPARDMQCANMAVRIARDLLLSVEEMKSLPATQLYRIPVLAAIIERAAYFGAAIWDQPEVNWWPGEEPTLPRDIRNLCISWPKLISPAEIPTTNRIDRFATALADKFANSLVADQKTALTSADDFFQRAVECANQAQVPAVLAELVVGPLLREFENRSYYKRVLKEAHKTGDRWQEPPESKLFLYQVPVQSLPWYSAASRSNDVGASASVAEAKADVTVSENAGAATCVRRLSAGNGSG